MSYDYVDLEAEPDPEENVITEYRVDTDLDTVTAGKRIAEEESTGTWLTPSTLSGDIFEKYGATVFHAEDDLTRIAFPAVDFSGDVGGIPQILSIIAGNLFGLASLRGVRLEDVSFPTDILENYPGPQFGIQGLRDVLDRPEKPLVGTIVKPKIGLPPEEFADYIYEAGRGGLTNGKDDETLVDQDFCPLEDRVAAVSEKLDLLEEEDHKMIHAHNVSTDGHRILEAADLAIDNGARQIMVDVITSGFAAVRALAEDPSIDVPIHVHRTMHAAFTRNPKHGISMNAIAKLVRMAGGDALHIGTLGVGKMHTEKDEERARDTLMNDMNDYPQVMHVASGGMHPGVIPQLMEKTGNQVQIQAGGGVSGHPDGVRAGARAMCQAVDAAYEGVELEEYAEEHEELRKALEKWGRGRKTV